MDKKKGAGLAGVTSQIPPWREIDKKAELLAELGAIDKLLVSAMYKDNFCKVPVLSVTRAPQITYSCVKRLVELLRKIVDRLPEPVEAEEGAGLHRR